MWCLQLLFIVSFASTTSAASILRTRTTSERLGQRQSCRRGLHRAWIDLPSCSDGEEARITIPHTYQYVERNGEHGAIAPTAAAAGHDGSDQAFRSAHGGSMADETANRRPIAVASLRNKRHKRALELRKRSDDDQWTLMGRLDRALSRRAHWQNLLRDEDAPEDRKKYWRIGVADETAEIERCRKLLKDIRLQRAEADHSQQAQDARVEAAKRELRSAQNARYQYNKKLKSYPGSAQQNDWRFLRNLAQTRISRAKERLKELAMSRQKLGPVEMKQRIMTAQRWANQLYRQIKSGGTSEQVKQWTADRNALLQQIVDDTQRLGEMQKELEPKASRPGRTKVGDNSAVQDLKRLLLNAQMHQSKLKIKIESGKGTPQQVERWVGQQPEVRDKVQKFHSTMLELKTAVKQLEVARRGGTEDEIRVAEGNLRELEATVAKWKKTVDARSATKIANQKKLEAQLASVQQKIKTLDDRIRRSRKKNSRVNDWEAERARLAAEAEDLERKLNRRRPQSGQGSNRGGSPSEGASSAGAESGVRRSSRQKKTEPDRLNAESVTAVVERIRPWVHGAGGAISQGWKRPWPQLYGGVSQPPRRLPTLGRVILR